MQSLLNDVTCMQTEEVHSSCYWLCDWIGSSIPLSQGSSTGKEDYSLGDNSVAHYGQDLFFQ